MKEALVLSICILRVCIPLFILTLEGLLCLARGAQGTCSWITQETLTS